MKDARMLPVIKIEIEGMRHAICTMLHEHAMTMDETFQAAVNDFLKPENMEIFIKETVAHTMRGVIGETIREYFTYGEGKKAIRDAVKQAFAPPIAEEGDSRG